MKGKSARKKEKSCGRRKKRSEQGNARRKQQGGRWKGRQRNYVKIKRLDEASRRLTDQEEQLAR